MPFIVTDSRYFGDDGTLSVMASARSMNALLEHWAMADSPAHAVHRLRGPHHPVRLRHRGHHRRRRFLEGVGRTARTRYRAVLVAVPGHRHRAWAPCGPTWCSAGAATGAGIRWRTPACSRGSWAWRSSTPSRCTASAARSSAGACSCARASRSAFVVRGHVHHRARASCSRCTPSRATPVSLVHVRRRSSSASLLAGIVGLIVRRKSVRCAGCGPTTTSPVDDVEGSGLLREQPHHDRVRRTSGLHDGVLGPAELAALRPASLCRPAPTTPSPGPWASPYLAVLAIVPASGAGARTDKKAVLARAPASPALCALVLFIGAHDLFRHVPSAQLPGHDRHGRHPGLGPAGAGQPHATTTAWPWWASPWRAFCSSTRCSWPSARSRRVDGAKLRRRLSPVRRLGGPRGPWPSSWWASSARPCT